MNISSIAAMQGNRRGATVVEFALIIPVFLLTMCGTFDLAHQLYMRSVLQGSVQKAARDTSLESGAESQRQAALDAAVTRQVKNLHQAAEVTITRRFYRTFSDAAAKTSEPFPGGNDTNGNGRCDNGEAFVDLNRNGVRDLDGGDDGQGTAQDKTLYTVAISVPRLFPIWRFIGGSSRFEVKAVTVLANQPYSDQATYSGSTDGHCRP